MFLELHLVCNVLSHADSPGNKNILPSYAESVIAFMYSFILEMVVYFIFMVK